MINTVVIWVSWLTAKQGYKFHGFETIKLMFHLIIWNVDLLEIPFFTIITDVIIKVLILDINRYGFDISFGTVILPICMQARFGLFEPV